MNDRLNNEPIRYDTIRHDTKNKLQAMMCTEKQRYAKVRQSIRTGTHTQIN